MPITGIKENPMSNEQEINKSKQLAEKLVQGMNGKPVGWRKNYPPASNNFEWFCKQTLQRVGYDRFLWTG
jgi:hypothetical protein